MSSGTTHPVHSRFELNCDLGEGESPERTEALLARVDLANIACGGHAGDEATMLRCLELALRHHVRPGAHPGLCHRRDFGRGEGANVTEKVLADLLVDQVGRLLRCAENVGISLHHIKLHGALYHAVETDPGLAGAYLGIVRRLWPGLRIIAFAGGAVEQLARVERDRNQGGVEIWSEGFLDRGYRDDATLVPRSETGALLDDPNLVRERLLDLLTKGGCRSVSGRWLTLGPRTLCVHGDGRRAVEMLDVVRAHLPGSRIGR